MKLCDYGCGRKAYYQLNNGKWCCENYWQTCPKNREMQKIIMKEVMNRKSSKLRIHKMRKGTKDSDETKEKKRLASLGNQYKKGKKESSKTRLKKKIAHTMTLEDYKKKHPLFCKVEELREEPKTKKIQGRCKNNKCPNSKENNGWFTLKPRQLEQRMMGIYYGKDGSYFYCSNKCKHNCILFNKSASQLNKEIEIKTGNLKEKLYTDEEYQTFRKEVLERDNYKCIYCDEKATHVHHIRPQKLEPFFVLDPDYAISVCSNCHYKYGHKKGTECSTGNLAKKLCE